MNDTYESVKHRLLKYIEFKGLTKASFQKAAGLSNGYLDKLRQSPSPDKIEQISNSYPDLNRVWLLTGEGDMLIQDSEKAEEPSVDSSPQCQVPLIPIAAQGGSLGEFASRLHEYDCEKVISPIKGVDMAICVSGDSMAPEYPSGCQILVKKINERAFIDWGRVYVLDTVNGAVIKKVLPSDSPDKVLCVSINPDYPPFEVSFEHIHAFYRVMMMMSLK